MFEHFRPLIETAVRHGLTSLATVLLASAMSNPFAAALISATGLETPQIINAAVGFGLALFVSVWSYVKGVKFAALK